MLRRRVAQDRRPGAAEVAGADDDPFLPALPVGDAQPDDRRAEDVPGVDERGVDARRDLDLLAVAERLELGERDLGVLGGVQRRVEVHVELGRLGAQVGLGVARPRPGGLVHGSTEVGTCSPVAPRRRGHGLRLAARGLLPDPCQLDGLRVLVGLLAVVGLDLVGVALLPARVALGELLVELARVEQDQGRQLDRSGGRVDRAAVPGLHSSGQQPAVVEVGVGQQHRVELGRVERERDPVADRFVRAALEHAAVDQDPGPLGDEQELRARDRGGAAEELDVHRRHGDSATAAPRILRADGPRGGGAVVRRAAGRPRRHRRRAQPRGACRPGRRLDDRPRAPLPSAPAPLRGGPRGADRCRPLGRRRARAGEHARRPGLAGIARADAGARTVRRRAGGRGAGGRTGAGHALPPVRGGGRCDSGRRRDARPADGPGPAGHRARPRRQALDSSRRWRRCGGSSTATATRRAPTAACSDRAPHAGRSTARRSRPTPAPSGCRRDRSSRRSGPSWPPGDPSSGPAASSRGTTGTRSAAPPGGSSRCCPPTGCSSATTPTWPRWAPIPTGWGSPMTSTRDPAGRRSRSRSRSAWAAGRPSSRRAAPGRRGRHGSSRRTRPAVSATSSSCSTRAAMPSTRRPFGRGRRSSTGRSRIRPSSRGPRMSSAGTPPSPPGSGAGSARPPSRARPSSIATGR